MRTSYELEVGFATDVGLERQRNEDSFAIYVPYPGDPNPSELAGLLLVADGMGGERAGDRASQLAAERLRHWLTSGEYREWPEHRETGLEGTLRRAVRQVSDEIFALGEEDPSIRGLGSTLVLAAFTGRTVTVANVGDSRCYRVRDGVIEQLSVDHSWVARQVDAGVLSPEEARRHPQRNVLTRSLGDAQPPEPELRTESLSPGDVFLLCSDGLTGGVEDPDLLEKAWAQPTPQLLADELVRLANERDGSDNVTVVAGRVYEASDETVELSENEITTVLSAPADEPDLDATGPELGATQAIAEAVAIAEAPAATGSRGPTSRGCGGQLLVAALATLLGAAAALGGLRYHATQLVDRAETYRSAGELEAARSDLERFFAILLDDERRQRMMSRLQGLADPAYAPLPTDPASSEEATSSPAVPPPATTVDAIPEETP